MTTPGYLFHAALQAEQPLVLLGAPTPFAAIQMQAKGFRAAYLSGAGMSYFTYGVPDVGLLELAEVVAEVKKFRRVCDLPLLVDVDTGWGDPAHTVRELIAAGAAAMHIEDQTEDKRCGHLDGKSIVSTADMCARIQAAVSGKAADPDFIVMARTDALAMEGLAGAIARIQAYVTAGADAIFAEAMTELDHYTQIKQAIAAVAGGRVVPLLANVTEFGKTPLYTRAELASVGVDMMLLPVSLNRAMHGMVDGWLDEIKTTGTTKGLVASGALKDRKFYSALIDYDPQVDSRATVRARLEGRAASHRCA